MPRTTIYLPEFLYRWWQNEAPDVVLSDFVRLGLAAERSAREAGTHQVRTPRAGTKKAPKPRGVHTG